MNNYKLLIAISLAIHLLAAWFGEGFHHFDEHFQVIEYINFKLGHTPENGLTWEFAKQIRPWLLPTLFFGVAKVADVFSIQSPFALALLLRLLSAIVGWLSLVLLVRCFSDWFKDKQLERWAVYGTLFLWFVPYLHARTSSENWSGSLFVIGLSLLIGFMQKQMKGEATARPMTLLLVGLLFGFAFHCRYQMGIAIMGAILWLGFFGRLNKRELSSLGFGLSLSLGIGWVCDYWGYGTSVLAPWNYLRTNLLEGKASQFGVSPWWDYFRLIFLKAIPPISLALIVGTLLSWFIKPKLSLTWVTLPFFVVHCFIAHKELRFLFPIVSFIVPAIYIALDNIARYPAFERGVNRVVRNKALQLFIIGLNGLLLIGCTLMPARSEIALYREIHRNQIQRLALEGADPFIQAGLLTYFYLPRNLILSPWEASLPSQWILTEGPFDKKPKQEGQCRSVATSVPKFLFEPPFERVGPRIHPKVWTLWNCSQANPS